ncbi:MAG: carbamoyl phosphate synthase large subunit, partial [Pseudomonadota bacterium]
MGVGASFAEAFAKAQMSAGETMPSGGRVFISVRDRDKPTAVDIAVQLSRVGFEILATDGTADVIAKAGVNVRVVNKVRQGRPHIVDMLKNDEIDLIINTTEGARATADSFSIRRTALERRIAYATTVAGGACMAIAIEASGQLMVSRLQDLHKEMAA